MHYIEEKLTKFISNHNLTEKNVKALSQEFSERMHDSILSRFNDNEKKSFNLRMSNIGLPLRQLCLQRDYGREFSPTFTLSGFYGTMLEHFTLFLLRASGVNVQEVNKKTELKIGDFRLRGELDLIIDGAVWDVKSASPYSYDNKFKSYEHIKEDDPFGYVGQLYGYSMAENLPAGGWIVINKAKGLIKVIPVPIEVQKTTKQYYLRDFQKTIDHVVGNMPAPPCTGVVKEYFRSKETGNSILNRDCEFCPYKTRCHPTVKCLPSLVSSAIDKPTRYYVNINEKYAIN